MITAERARHALDGLVSILEEDPTASVNLYLTNGAGGTHVSATVHRKPGGNWSIPDGPGRVQTSERGHRTLVQTTGDGYNITEWVEFFPMG